MKIYTEKHMNKLEFHESLIRAIHFKRVGKFDNRIIFDINYVLKWIKSKKNEQYISFVKSLGKLEFHNVTDLDISIKWYENRINYRLDDFRIDEIKSKLKKLPTRKKYFIYEIIPHDLNGSIRFSADGFRLILKKEGVKHSN